MCVNKPQIHLLSQDYPKDLREVITPLIRIEIQTCNFNAFFILILEVRRYLCVCAII